MDTWMKQSREQTHHMGREMNERIRELAEQAQDWTDAHAPYASEEHEYFTKKFAELIVRKCALLITGDDLAKDCDTFLMDSYAKGMRYSAHLIKEHFGVEIPEGLK
jgi:hypothetical protein